MEQYMLLEKTLLTPLPNLLNCSGLYYTRLSFNKIWCHSKILYGNTVLLSAFHPFCLIKTKGLSVKGVLKSLPRSAVLLIKQEHLPQRT